MSAPLRQTTNQQAGDRQNDRFACLGAPRRVWAVGAIHGDAARLASLHDALYRQIEAGDRIVYLGNYGGPGAQTADVVDEILTFRRTVLALPGMAPADFVFLRGAQEEMWNKLLQIQFAPNPPEVLSWMLGNGLAATLASYGVNVREGLTAAQEGVMSLTKWIARVRTALRRRPGHEVFTTQWRRAAYTAVDLPAPLLFVNAGLDPRQALEDQGDNFWWAGKTFDTIEAPYAPFHKVVRGFDPSHGGIHLNCVKATIDGGCGFGGTLPCVGFGADGEPFGVMEA